jgi:hypothetical protein
MRKMSLALAAIALGAGAAYFLDPRQGPQRRKQLRLHAEEWLDAVQQGTSRQTHAVGDWMHQMQDRLKERSSTLRDDGLAPLSMTPEPLEKPPGSRLLTGLAVATPVAVAVGAALMRQRSEEGDWLH